MALPQREPHFAGEAGVGVRPRIKRRMREASRRSTEAHIGGRAECGEEDLRALGGEPPLGHAAHLQVA